MNKKYEILAPAGSFEALRAAVQNGADAVYLSGKEFGARKFANNFSNEELIEAVNYCHVRDVEVYVTVNTLVFNHELEKLKKYIDFLYYVGVDAVIVQDIGVLNYIRNTYPDLEIHCSTQMSVQTVEDIKYLESLGANRVVLGREMTIEDIKKAKGETNVQLEVFIHGALCISVSGQCLMSSMIGGRSGNRGSCAQPCRQKYTLYNIDKDQNHESIEGDHLLSPKDLNTIENIKDIVDAGAFSLKIEGRMKSPEYVATVVGAYKLALELDGKGEHYDINDLQKKLTIFNRGFTKGHLFGESGSMLMSTTSPSNQGYYLGKVIKYHKKLSKVSIVLATDLNHNDEIQIRRKGEIIGGRVERLEYKGSIVRSCKEGQICEVNFKHNCFPGEEIYKTFDEEQVKLAKQTFDKENLEIPVYLNIEIRMGSNITCSISDGSNTVFEEINLVPQGALKKAITVQEVKEQLSKLGGTPYKAVNIEVSLGEGLFVQMKELNEIRRQLVEKLTEKRAVKYNRKSRLDSVIEVQKLAEPAQGIQFTYSVGSVLQLEKLINLGAEIIYYKDLDTLGQAIKLIKEKSFKGQLIPEIFKLISDQDTEKYKEMLIALNLDTVLIQSYGHINKLNEFKLITDYNLNVVNDLSYDFYLQGNFQRISLSPELNLAQITAMNLLPTKTEILGYGYIPVMAMKHCVVSTTQKKEKNCGLCHKNSYALIDKMNENFKVLRRYKCYTEIHNSKKLFLLEDFKAINKAGVGYYRLNFVEETPMEIEKIVELHRKYTSSQISAKDQKDLAILKDSKVTKGHLNRGVE